MNLLDRVSSWLAVTYYKQTPAKRFGLLLCYLATILIVGFLVIATLSILFT
jgi:hypothetical protein